ncbi:hypothetical protein DFP72DRAFT_1112569 [Ephemerocybe angulata]|uniref:Uncharacterized protein n=1 Tax=Ephemerocybe angulata TaxID=980116 RepID=A0A8H6LT24_9AGAR|nr:hypothetical protein DFP72DRAFT_1112569 [Tulosesus angulatus]
MTCSLPPRPEASISVSLTTPRGSGSTNHQSTSIGTVISTSPRIRKVLGRRDLRKAMASVATEMAQYDENRKLEYLDIADSVQLARNELHELSTFLRLRNQATESADVSEQEPFQEPGLAEGAMHQDGDGRNKTANLQSDSFIDVRGAGAGASLGRAQGASVRSFASRTGHDLENKNKNKNKTYHRITRTTSSGRTMSWVVLRWEQRRGLQLRILRSILSVPVNLPIVHRLLFLPPLLPPLRPTLFLERKDRPVAPPLPPLHCRATLRPNMMSVRLLQST